MSVYIVKLSRSVTEIATIEVEAQDTIHAANLAFKEIDRMKGDPADERIKLVSIALKPVGDNIWEEESADLAPAHPLNQTK
jgi:hypothetical protein